MKVPAALMIAAVVLLVAMGMLGPEGGGATWTDNGAMGHSDLADRLTQTTDVRVIKSSLALLPEKAGEGDVLFLFPTHRPAGDAEIDRVERFVANGGTLVIAADGGNAASWAKALGVNFKGLPVVLPPDQQADCVPVEVPWLGGTHSVCLPGPTAFPDLEDIIEGTVEFTAVSFSGFPVFIDLVGDGEIRMGDHVAPAPMVLQWDHGTQSGRIVGIADGDVWRNYIVREQPANLEFAHTLAQEARSGTVYLDNSGSQVTVLEKSSNPWYRLIAGPDTTGFLVLTAVVLAMIVAAVLAPRVRRMRPHSPPGDSEDPDVRRLAMAVLHKEEPTDPRT